MMRPLLDLDHEFFRPLGVRVAVTAVCLGWGLFEFATGAPFWGVLFGALGIWCGWHFFLKPPSDSTSPED